MVQKGGVQVGEGRNHHFSTARTWGICLEDNQDGQGMRH